MKTCEEDHLIRDRLPEPARRVTEIQIRGIETQDEYRACEDLQTKVWGGDDFVRVPALVLITAKHNGGAVLGAFLTDGRLAGFVCSFPGFTSEGRVKHCSQLLAVDPAHRSSGIGYWLKLRQRDVALAQGLDLITWTFDPLASVNGYFNLGKLGCIASCYLVDCYGTPEGGLNGGLSSDRLLAEWWIRAPSVAARLAGRFRPLDSPVKINRVVRRRPSGLPANGAFRLDLSEPELLLEIPSDVRVLKRRDLELAKAWRLELREIFSAYLGAGYRVDGFKRWRRDGELRAAYLLSRRCTG
jgi:predicted GNAT superfamily acetyltransferase